jgi:hypothetical protein
MNKKFKANISLTTVLVTTSILLLGGIGVIINSIDLAKSTRSANNFMLNELRARNCIEEGLYRMKLNPSFTGQVNVSFTDGNCIVDISIDPQNGNYRIFAITSIINDYQYSITKHIDITQNPFVILD